MVYRVQLWTFLVSVVVGLIGLRVAYDISPLLFHCIVEILFVTAWREARGLCPGQLPAQRGPRAP